MKKRLSTIISHSCVMVTLAAVLLGCGEEGSRVATRENGVITVDYSAAMAIENSEVKLSDFVRDYSYVQLGGDFEDYVERVLRVSENYILANRVNSSVKLFDRESGEFIRDIGTTGNGPGEYNSYIASVDINEMLGRVYVGDNTSVYIYDIDGAFISKVDVGKGLLCSNIYSDKKTGTLNISAGDFGANISSINKYTSDGELIARKTIEGEENPVVAFSSVLYLFDGQNLYHHSVHLHDTDNALMCYDVETMESTPVMTVVNLGGDVLSEIENDYAWFKLKILGRYFMIQRVKQEIASNGIVLQTPLDMCFIDRESLEVIKTDYLFDDYLQMPLIYKNPQGDEYFYYAITPLAFVRQLNMALEKLPEDADASSVERMKRMLKEIDEEGGLVVVSGSYK